MTLRSKLLSIPPRENSGSISSNRFDYQKDWALCKLLELHESRTDYLVVFEYHDDIIILDSVLNPTKLQTYQIKTKKSGSWTLAALLKADTSSGQQLSFFGKLYNHFVNYPAEIDSINFVSNAYFNLKLNPNGESGEGLLQICLKDLCIAEIEKTKSHILDHFHAPPIAGFEQCIFFHVTDLPILTHTEVTKSRLHDFVERMNPNAKYQPNVFYRTLFDEIKRKSTYEPNLSNFDDLVKRKGISKDDFARMIKCVLESETKSVWIQAESRLNAEQISYTELRALERCWQQYHIERIGAGNDLLHKIVTTVQKVMSDGISNSQNERLTDYLEHVYSKYRLIEVAQQIYDGTYIKAIILAELYERK
jgi:Cap4 dsDNA endonuclease